MEEKIQRCYQLKNRFISEQKLSAKFDLMIGELFFHLTKKLSALQVYEKMIETYPAEKEYCAIAQIRIAEIYTDFGQHEQVIKSFLKVVVNYPDQHKWVNEALEKILDLVKEEDAYSTIAAYRNIIGKYSHYPRLAARAHLKIGQLLIQQKAFQEAIEELLLINNNYPGKHAEILCSPGLG